MHIIGLEDIQDTRNLRFVRIKTFCHIFYNYDITIDFYGLLVMLYIVVKLS